jgi:4-amino-4-deoxy-L-arabinose transferase-like glycosyltransferase
LSLPDPDHIPLGAGRPQARPLLTTSVVIYATLVLLALAVPRALVNWSKNFEPNPAQDVLLRGAQAVQSLSQRLHLDRPYARGRELFLQLTGKQDD